MPGRLERSLLTLSMLALLSASTAACGEAGKSLNSTTRTASSQVAHGIAAGSATISKSFLNDGDREPSNDGDLDNRYVNQPDEDDDYPEDHLKTENNSYRDADDGGVVAYGHAASASENRAVARLVERYLAASVAGDGAQTCAMLVAGLAKTLPEAYSGRREPSYLHGGTCVAIMARLLRHMRSRLVGRIEVSGVRVDGDHAIALLGSATMPASYLSLQREHGGWRVGSLMMNTLP